MTDLSKLPASSARPTSWDDHAGAVLGAPHEEQDTLHPRSFEDFVSRVFESGRSSSGFRAYESAWTSGLPSSSGNACSLF